MFDFTISFCSPYYKPEKIKYITRCHYIILYISGMEYWRSGKLFRHDPKPYLGITTKGTNVDFHMNEKRENWVLGFESEDLSETDDINYVQIKKSNMLLKLPKVTYLGEDGIARIRNEFIKIKESCNFPDPANHACAKLGLLGLIRYILENNMIKTANTPAAQFKNYIDKDTDFHLNLDEISAKCGYSCDHLRILFENEFGISPLEYRNKYRLSLVNDLIVNTDCSIKEIAAKLGFKHVSHLSSLYKKHFGITPKEGIKKYRYHL